MSALPGLLALIGVIALGYAQANDNKAQDNQINDSLNRIGQTEKNQNNICTRVCFFIIRFIDIISLTYLY